MKRARTSSSCAPGKNEKWHICKGNQSPAAARQIADRLDRIPHNKYVEPFLGIGNVYRARRKHPEKEHLNDIDCNRVKLAKQRICSTKNNEKCMKIENAKVSCGIDYNSLLRNHDSDDTLFYIDPPYHDKQKSSKRYDSNTLDFNRFVKSVNGIKHAKVAISYSNNKDFKREFCNIKAGFKCYKIKKNILGKVFYNDILAVKR